MTHVVMIGFLEGSVQEKNNGTIVLMTAGGVGYLVHVSSNSLSSISLNSKLPLFIHTVVKDDAIDLYGFPIRKEMELFKLLISVSGIGPKTGLMIINGGIEGIISAVLNADVTFFTQIPKVGTKNAQKIIIELKSKIGSVQELDLLGGTDEAQMILQTLTGMGFTRTESADMIRKIPRDITELSEKIRYVLKHKNQ